MIYLLGKKDLTMELEKIIKEHFNLDKDDVIIANFKDMKDIGIVTHYKGKPFTGIGFWRDSDGKILEVLRMKDGLKHGKKVNFQFGSTKIEFYKNDLQEGKHTYESIRDQRFPSFKKFEYNLYYEQGKCINYDENFIKNCVNMLFRAYCLNELNMINEINDNSKTQIPYERFIFELRKSDKKQINKAISELKEGFHLKIKNNPEEIDFCKTIDSILKSKNISTSEKNRYEYIHRQLEYLYSEGIIEDNENPFIFLMEYLKDLKEDVVRKLDIKNFKTDILSLLEKEKIKSLYFNFYWVEPNREFELVDGSCSIDDFELIDETYNKIPNESFESWQIMTFTKQEKLLDILCEIDHPYDNTQQDCNCTLELKNDKLTYKIEADWDNGYFNHETGEWDEGNEDDALISFWEIKDEGIFNLIKE